eukprot:jgi/Botrbrau1/15236/Bobra.0149s0089.1
MMHLAVLGPPRGFATPGDTEPPLQGPPQSGDIPTAPRAQEGTGPLSGPLPVSAPAAEPPPCGRGGKGATEGAPWSPEVVPMAELEGTVAGKTNGRRLWPLQMRGFIPESARAADGSLQASVPPAAALSPAAAQGVLHRTASLGHVAVPAVGDGQAATAAPPPLTPRAQNTAEMVTARTITGSPLEANGSLSRLVPRKAIYWPAVLDHTASPGEQYGPAAVPQPVPKVAPIQAKKLAVISRQSSTARDDLAREGTVRLDGTGMGPRDAGAGCYRR